MEEKKNQATPQRPEGDRTVDAALVSIDLKKFISQIKSEPAWFNGVRNAITVFKSDHLRLVLIALHKDAELPRHTADGMISVQLLEGCVAFGTDDEVSTLKTGQLVTLHKNIPHHVKAIEESVFLLTMVV